jgi:hypothetical protein
MIRKLRIIKLFVVMNYGMPQHTDPNTFDNQRLCYEKNYATDGSVTW